MKNAIFAKFQKQLISICADKGLTMLPLCEVLSMPIWCISKNGGKKKKSVLIAAGFHGEEKAGPWGVIEWLRQINNKNIPINIHINILPVVNPTAFNKYMRYNVWNEKSNCGFCHPEIKDKLSTEGRILMDKQDMLLNMSKDGFLSLHEDIELRKEYYLYTFEPTVDPGQFTCSMLAELSDWFEKPLNGVSVTADSCIDTPPFVVNGLVYRYCDGSFEDFLFHRNVPRIAVTETPGKAKFSRRVDANVGLINRFLRLIEEGK